jgi:hypothetical protein
MQHLLSNKKIIYSAMGCVVPISLWGMLTYAGSPWLYAVFTAAMFLTLASARHGRFSYSYFFLVVFIWLGFWLKLTVHSILDYSYVEPIGRFDGSVSSWDEVLVVAISAAAGIGVSKVLYSMITHKFDERVNSLRGSVPDWYLSRRKFLWAAVLLTTVGILVVNALYGINQIGLVPRTVFPWPTNALISWITGIGAAIAISTLIWWDICCKRQVRLSVFSMFLEAALSTISLMSRGVYIFHTLPQIFSLYLIRRRLTLSLKDVVLLGAIFLLLFLITLSVITSLRGHFYPHAGLNISTSVNQIRLTRIEVLNGKIPEIERIIASGEPMENLRDFYKIHSLKWGVPLEPQRLEFIEERKKLEIALAAEQVRGEKLKSSATGQSKIVFEELLYQLKGGAVERGSQLVIDRWVGLEGLMAVQAHPVKGASLLMEGIREKREIGKVPLYQEICQSHYRLMDASKWQFGSLPGAVAFLYYSGYAWCVALGMAILALCLLLIEDSILVWTRNPLLCSLLGFNLANFVAQLGMAPRQDLPWYAMVLLSVAIIGFIQSMRFGISKKLQLKSEI